jgi:hypothetical protein
VKRHWNQFIKKIEQVVKECDREGCTAPFFRGQSNSSWSLKPGLGRRKYPSDLENWIYYDFITYGGHLLPPERTPWDVLFLMQHHGLPTRLLDWTESFAAALYFAIRGTVKEPTIWVLNPYELNKKFHQGEVLINPAMDLKFDYFDYFLNESKGQKFAPKVLAIQPTWSYARTSAQSSGFTLHRQLTKGLEEIAPEAISKVSLANDGIEEAYRFLRLAGVNEFSLFPDLDGLAGYLKKMHIDRT